MEVAPAKGLGAPTPGPIRGCPSLFLEQLWDLTVMGAMLSGVYFYGVGLQTAAEGEHGGHGEGHGEEHGGHDEHGGHHRALSGHHAVDPYLDVQVSVGIATLLIFITIAFEIAKHKVEHGTPPVYQAVLQAMFGELTVLGFIAMVTYFLLRGGVLEWASKLIYHDPEHLIHLFEDIHFMLFFIMIIFLLQACLLVNASIKADTAWTAFDKLLAMYAPPVDSAAGKGPWGMAMVQRLSATVKDSRGIPSILSAYRIGEAKDGATYALLRDRFIHPPSTDSASMGGSLPKLPPDFEFSAYLRRRCTHEAAHVLHVTPSTWMFVLAFIALVFEGPTVEHNKMHKDPNSYYVVGLGWALWLASMIIRWKVLSVQKSLTPVHATLTGVDEESASAKLLATVGAPPYETESQSSKHGSKHTNLFWRGAHGPHHLTFLMQLSMLFSSIVLAVMYTWLNSHPADTLVLLAAFLPVFDVMINHSKYLLPLIVMTTSVEQLKSGSEISTTLGEMKTEKMLRMLKLLNTLATQAKKGAKLAADTKGGKGAKKKPPPKIDPVQQEELTKAFTFFDKSGDGKIDSSELGGVLQSFGLQLTKDELQSMFIAMDADGSGEIELGEFINFMAEPAGKQSAEEIADGVFSLIAGKKAQVTRTELRDKLNELKAGLSDPDIDQAMALFDKDKSGSISKKEFRAAIIEMKTFT